MTERTRAQMIAAGISGAMADKVLADRERATAKARREFVEQSTTETSIRVLKMTRQAEEAAIRFMNDNGQRHKGMFLPGDVWVLGYSMLSTTHMGLLPMFRLKSYPKKITLPCSLDDVLDLAARPAISEHEAQFRADCFAQDVLERARHLYRRGFYADPFAFCPRLRDQPAGSAPAGCPISDAPATILAGVSVDRPVGHLRSGHPHALEPEA